MTIDQLYIYPHILWMLFHHRLMLVVRNWRTWPLKWESLPLPFSTCRRKFLLNREHHHIQHFTRNLNLSVWQSYAFHYFTVVILTVLTGRSVSHNHPYPMCWKCWQDCVAGTQKRRLALFSFIPWVRKVSSVMFFWIKVVLQSLFM